jgi:hypothetical protein
MIKYMIGKICKIEGCKNILKWNDGQICQAHRSRFFRHKNYDISPNWRNLKKGQPCISKSGYFRINIDGKRVLQHRYIMEQFLKRKLKRKETIHHINHIKTDNRIENLELLKNESEHMKKYHNDKWKTRKISPPYSPKEISNVIKRINIPSKTYIKCFCKRKVDSRNLCEKHYQWVWKHKFI